MAAANEPDPGTDAARAEAPAAPSAHRRTGRLDRRTLAICVCLAVMGAAVAGLVASIVLQDDGSAPAAQVAEMELEADEPAVEGGLLAVALESREGEPTDLAALVGDAPLALVNLWQSSCIPCIDEMPLLEQGQLDNPDVAFVGVATQDRPEKAEELAASTGVTYPWALDPVGDLFYAAEGTGMPTTLLIDGEGTILARETGAFADAAELQAFIDDHRG